MPITCIQTSTTATIVTAAPAILYAIHTYNGDASAALVTVFNSAAADPTIVEILWIAKPAAGATATFAPVANGIVCNAGIVVTNADADIITTVVWAPLVSVPFTNQPGGTAPDQYPPFGVPR
jgi:hypothetical protein